VRKGPDHRRHTEKEKKSGEKMYSEKYEAKSKSYLREVRGAAMIEYRDVSSRDDLSPTPSKQEKGGRDSLRGSIPNLGRGEGVPRIDAKRGHKGTHCQSLGRHTLRFVKCSMALLGRPFGSPVRGEQSRGRRWLRCADGI